MGAMQGPDCPRKVPSPPRGSGLPRPQARLILQRHCAPHSPTQGPGDPKWWEGAVPSHKGVFPMRVFEAGVQGTEDTTSPGGVSGQ